jgi:hypothetical protein
VSGSIIYKHINNLESGDVLEDLYENHFIFLQRAEEELEVVKVGGVGSFSKILTIPVKNVMQEIGTERYIRIYKWK